MMFELIALILVFMVASSAIIFPLFVCVGMMVLWCENMESFDYDE